MTVLQHSSTYGRLEVSPLLFPFHCPAVINSPESHPGFNSFTESVRSSTYSRGKAMCMRIFTGVEIREDINDGSALRD